MVIEGTEGLEQYFVIDDELSINTEFPFSESEDGTPMEVMSPEEFSPCEF